MSANTNKRLVATVTDASSGMGLLSALTGEPVVITKAIGFESAQTSQNFAIS